MWWIDSCSGDGVGDEVRIAGSEGEGVMCDRGGKV